ncbi:MAG: hypothetical protein RL264_470 [Bacteroidota bacterium]|jgi:hypothetical protein
MTLERMVKIGLERSFEIFNETKSKKTTLDSANELYEHFTHLHPLFPENSLQIIGMVNLGYPVIKDEHKNDIYVLRSTDPNDLPLLIAISYESLNQILDMIENAWRGKVESDWLTKTDENKKLKSETLSKISEISSTIDLSFWDWIAFREMSISMN